MGSPCGQSQYVPRQNGKNHRNSRSRFDGDFSPLLRKILRDMGVGIEEYENILKEL